MSYIYLMKSYLGGGHLGFAQLYWLRLQKDCRLGGAFQAHESLLPYGYLFASDIYLERPQKTQKLTWTSKMEHIVCNMRNKFVVFSGGGGIGFDVLRIGDFSLCTACHMIVQ